MAIEDQLRLPSDFIAHRTSRESTPHYMPSFNSVTSSSPSNPSNLFADQIQRHYRLEREGERIPMHRIEREGPGRHTREDYDSEQYVPSFTDGEDNMMV